METMRCNCWFIFPITPCSRSVFNKLNVSYIPQSCQARPLLPLMHGAAPTAGVSCMGASRGDHRRGRLGGGSRERGTRRSQQSRPFLLGGLPQPRGGGSAPTASDCSSSPIYGHVLCRNVDWLVDLPVSCNLRLENMNNQ